MPDGALNRTPWGRQRFEVGAVESAEVRLLQEHITLVDQQCRLQSRRDRAAVEHLLHTREHLAQDTEIVVERERERERVRARSRLRRTSVGACPCVVAVRRVVLMPCCVCVEL